MTSLRQVFEFDKISAALEPRMQFNLEYGGMNKCMNKCSLSWALSMSGAGGQYNKVSNNNKQSNPILLHLQCIACIVTSQS
eukprot:scaffold4962_cov151-Skeletonema_dohrnii-CCMP3373.AAC.3